MTVKHVTVFMGPKMSIVQYIYFMGPLMVYEQGKFLGKALAYIEC